MKKIILVLILLVNSFYYLFYIFNFESPALVNKVWTLFFIIGILISSYFLFQYLKKSGFALYLTLAVLIMSITSLGAFGFRNLIDGFF
jgi:hypothetical protein